jgi:hypothetical protein
VAWATLKMTLSIDLVIRYMDLKPVNTLWNLITGFTHQSQKRINSTILQLNLPHSPS